MSFAGSFPLATTLTGFRFFGTQGTDTLNVSIAQLDARYGGGGAALLSANNLSDLPSPSTARTSLGLGSAALLATASLLLAANNLSDLASAATARTNLGATSVGSALFTAVNAGAAQSALGLGSLATASTVNGGNWSGTDLAIADGGTGQSTAIAAFDGLSPLTTKGDLLGWDSSHNVRVGVDHWRHLVPDDATVNGCCSGDIGQRHASGDQRRASVVDGRRMDRHLGRLCLGQHDGQQRRL